MPIRISIIIWILVLIMANDLDCAFVETDDEPIVMVEFGEIWIKNLMIP